MKIKFKKIFTAMLMVLMLSIPTVASASLFYNVSGYSNVSWDPNGVYLYASSSTTADVDLIQVQSKVYIYGYYQGFIINSANDAHYIDVYTSRSYFGTVDMLTTHVASDWTGDEVVYTSDTYYR